METDFFEPEDGRGGPELPLAHEDMGGAGHTGVDGVLPNDDGLPGGDAESRVVSIPSDVQGPINEADAALARMAPG
jgi:hypothetical protein